MILRRFPWKKPTQDDTSYKLFTATPEPGEPGYDELRSMQTGKPPCDHTDESSASSTKSTERKGSQQTSMKGPWRLLRLLPRDSRHIIGRMLEVNPANRATLDDMLADRWCVETPFCSQEDNGQVIRAEGHEHVLEPGSGSDTTSKK